MIIREPDPDPGRAARTMVLMAVAAIVLILCGTAEYWTG